MYIILDAKLHLIKMKARFLADGSVTVRVL